MNSEIIKPPERILSDVGRDVKDFVELLGELPSRRRAFEDLKGALEKIKRIEGKVEPIFIVGEWGEGKTTLYDAYLNTVKDIGATFAVSTSTVVEYLKGISKKQYLPEGESPGYKLLSAILASLTENQKSKLKNLGVENLPSITNYNNSLSFVNDYLNKLYGYLISNYPYIIIYLDEFEDIVTIKNNDLLGLIFSGLNEIINGIVEEMFIGKQSKIHLIISVTPPALARLGVSGLDTIVGRLERRRNRVDLTPLSRDERLLFIRNLIKYMWDTNDDLILKIFSPTSLINPLVVATLGNIAALKKAIEETIIKSIDTENKVFNLISFNNMYKILRELKVNIAGAELELFNKTLFDKILSNWEGYCRHVCEHLRAKPSFTYEESKHILELFIVTFGILPRQEIPEITNIDLLKIQEIISQLNRTFGERAIIGSEFGTRRFVYQTEKLPSFSKVKRYFELLKEEILRQIPSLEEFTSGQRIEEDVIEQILDRMSFVDEKGELCLFIPSLENLNEAKDYIKEIVPAEISDDEALKFYTILRDKFLKQCREIGILPEEKYYVLSPRLIDILYLSPQLLHLDFIADRPKRFEIWRKLLASITSADLAYGFATLLQELKVTVTDYRALPGVSENLHFAELNHLETGSRIRTLLLTVPRAITEDDINSIVKILKENIKNKPIHCVIMLYTYEIQETAKEKLNAIENEYFAKIIKIKVPSHLQLVKLGAIGRVLRETFVTLTLPNIQSKVEEIISYGGYDQETSFEVSRLVATLRTLSSDLNLDEKFREVFESLVTLKNLKLETQGVHVDSPSKLRDGLRYFLVFPGDQGNFSECLEHARKGVMRYHIYGWRRGILSGDIESEEELTKRAVILGENKYLEANSSTGEWKLTPLTPIEKRIIKILKSEGGETTEDHLKEYFIVLAQSAHLQVILKILDDKGIIKYDDKKGKIKLIPPEIVRDRIEKLLNAVEEILEKDKDLIKNFGVICSAKERDYRLAVMKDFFNIIKKYLDLANSSISVGEIEESLRYLKTAEDLLNIYEDLRRYIENSSNIIKKILKEFEKNLDQLNSSTKTLEDLINKYIVKKQIKINLKKTSDLVEAKKIIDKEISKEYSLSEVENIIENEWSKNKGKNFIFYKDGTGPKYNFNFKFWKIVTLLYERGLLTEEGNKFVLSDLMHTLKKEIEDLCEKIREIVSNLTEVQGLVSHIREMCKKSRILSPLSQKIEEVYVAKIPIDREYIESMEDVKDLIELWIRQIGNVENLIRSLKKVLERIQQIIRKESNLNNLRERMHEIPSKLKHQFSGCEDDFEGIINEIENFSKYLDSIPKEIEDIKKEVEEFSKICSMAEIPEWIKENVLNKLESLESEFSDRVGSILRKVEVDYFGSIKTLQISINCAIRLESRIPPDYINEYSQLKEEFTKLDNTLNQIPKSNLEELHTCGASLCLLYINLNKVEKELWNLIKKTGILIDSEIKVYREYVSIKLQKQKEMPLNEFASKISESLNLDASEVKEVLKSLINKEIIIPKL